MRSSTKSNGTKGRYLFTIINTGLDEEHGLLRGQEVDSKPRWLPHKQILYRDKSYLCDLEALNKPFLASILPARTCNTVTQEVLQEIDASMMRHSTAQQRLGRLHHAQGRGSCSVKCITTEIQDPAFKAFRTQKIIDDLTKLEKTIDRDILEDIYKEKGHSNLDRSRQVRRCSCTKGSQKAH